MTPELTVRQDPWSALRRHTEARIALGRCGVSLPLAACLDFRLAHARARDAVRAVLDEEAVCAGLAGLGLDCLRLRSAAADGREFLTRPDLGRRLARESAALLEEYAASGRGGADICLVLSNGLSARAIHDNAVPFAAVLVPLLRAAGLSLAPAVIVRNGRVAVADEVGLALRAGLSVQLIGERPGLSAPNSMGVYLTYDPRPGRADNARNCISNLRPGGLDLPEGARKLCYLIQRALALRCSGVALKDDMPASYLPFTPNALAD
jgi:ethanolamine ammonia-lyase small subunit